MRHSRLEQELQGWWWRQLQQAEQREQVGPLLMQGRSLSLLYLRQPLEQLLVCHELWPWCWRVCVRFPEWTLGALEELRTQVGWSGPGHESGQGVYPCQRRNQSWCRWGLQSSVPLVGGPQ